MKRRLCFFLLVEIACAFSAWNLQAAPQKNQKQQSGGQKTIELGDFKDIDDLNLDDLLDVPISIAAGKVQRLEEAPSIVSVITADEIRRLGARTLEDVLQIIPGYEVLTDNEGTVTLETFPQQC
ncbi:MAG TPA: TonB-dependent receptor plug domain-containing protein [Acidobacteriota bacterium]|jgi:outer membrane receptor for ferrienterochelin and colicin